MRIQLCSVNLDSKRGNKDLRHATLLISFLLEKTVIFHRNMFFMLKYKEIAKVI